MRQNGRLGPHKAPAGRFTGKSKSPSSDPSYRKGKGHQSKKQRKNKRHSHINKYVEHSKFPPGTWREERGLFVDGQRRPE